MKRRPRPWNDNTLGVPFPGKKLPREAWTRTRVGLGAPGHVFDWAAAFGREAPRVLDLGCGNGRYLIAAGFARPDADHLGVELVPQSIKAASLRAGQRGLTNVKFAWGDATEFLLERCLPGSLAEVHLYHPRPLRVGRPAGRRQLDGAVLLGVWRALQPGGRFVLQTDDPYQAAYARAAAPLLFDWREREGPWPDAPRGRTLREIVALSRGLELLRAEGTRRELSEGDAKERAARTPDPTPPRRRGSA